MESNIANGSVRVKDGNVILQLLVLPWFNCNLQGRGILVNAFNPPYRVMEDQLHLGTPVLLFVLSKGTHLQTCLKHKSQTSLVTRP
ncbi:hypothetical protein C1H46_004914 [Malus baccata]|uniref:Uncharacterized protein n=1 Tax=Malus baccata TaxID=106549 RepID=A0A540NEG4_MALBA|nr:hypothetical protein C1H46_004914 [Malus baccata]